MLMPASSEFIALGQAQVSILTQVFGASLSVVYLTEELTDALDAKLIPVVAHPEAVAGWDASQVLSLLSLGRRSVEANLRLLMPQALTTDASVSRLALPAADLSEPQTAKTADSLSLQQQIVVPLVHEGVVMGLLVTARSDRPWSNHEHDQIERIAQTLSIACILDQRSQWLDSDLRQQRLLRSQQHDIFDDLLHQFRNPLTALRTFGKLLVKRLRPGEPNRDVAESIVRESDRLQDLLKQFDQAIDLGEADLLPLLQASNPDAWTGDVESVQQTWSTSGSSASQHMPLLPSTQFLVGTQLQLDAHAVTDVLEPLLESARAIAQDRQLTLHVSIPADCPCINVDIRALYEVLNNLVDNALKYTPAGGSVYIWSGQERISKQGTMLAIVIVDTGPGIPLQDQDHLFERHYRGVQAETDIPGTGLGLAIARDLVRQMHGEIEVFSPAQDSDLSNPFDTDWHLDGHLGTALVVWLPEATVL